MDDKIYVLYIDLDKVDIESIKHMFEYLQRTFPNKTLICLPKESVLTEMNRNQVIEDLQKTIDYLSQV